jgi:hypothetical protein
MGDNPMKNREHFHEEMGFMWGCKVVGCNNESKVTHTPTPWEVYSGREILAIRQKDMGVIVDLPTTRQATEDAAFIVRAVNSHEELLVTLKEAVMAIDNEIADRPMGNTKLPEIRAALARALAQAGEI